MGKFGDRWKAKNRWKYEVKTKENLSIAISLTRVANDDVFE